MSSMEAKEQVTYEPDNELIHGFIETIPNPDRIEAVDRAKQKLDLMLTNVWIEEREKLDQDFVNIHDLTPDLDGWSRYLRQAYDKEDYNARHGFEDFSNKYLAQMLILMEEDRYRESWGMPAQFTESFFDYYQRGGGKSPEIWWSYPKKLDEQSLLVHSIDSESLEKAIKSGTLGRGGVSTAAFCQDRIVYDRGYVVIYQANELLKVGYPMLQINEDIRDSKILKEWRSAVAVDINLARQIVLTSEIPDHEKASRAQIASSFFGEEYLRQIKRI